MFRPKFSEEQKRAAFEARFPDADYDSLERAAQQFRDACVRYEDDEGVIYKYSSRDNNWSRVESPSGF